MCAGEKIADQYTALHARAGNLFKISRLCLKRCVPRFTSCRQCKYVMQTKYTGSKVHPKDEHKICIHSTFQKLGHTAADR